MGEVIEFNANRVAEPKDLLEAALKKNLEGVIVIGYDREGEGYFSYSVGAEGDVVVMLEKVKLKFLLGEVVDEEVS